MIRVDEARATSHKSSAYRPEIDGLRAVAVIAVLINHLDHQWLPGGFLGVDLFFVISGYVVTASLARRQEASWQQLIGGFYTRRFRRLLPALLLMVAVTSVLFSLFVSAGDDQYAMSMQTGLASLIGISNLSLLRQGNNYFDFGTQFNPFLHTWSLGVEEQFYLIWPLLVMLCGVGFRSGQRAGIRRLFAMTVILSMASFFLYLYLSRGIGEPASFYLMPARFWELSAGAIVFLVQSLRSANQTISARSPFNSLADGALFLLVVVGFVLAADQAGRFKPVFVLATAGLLLSLTKQSFLGRCLSHPASLAVGVASYSLYLWHWPLIVLLRWTLGINALTLIPLLLAMALCTMGSYWIETRFRFGDVSSNWRRQPLILYPLATLLTAFPVFLMSKLFANKIFLGNPTNSPQNFSVSRSIPGTTIATYNCFLNPDAPVSASKENNQCQSGSNPSLPTLFFEGDSIAHSLIPMLERLYESGLYNISFFARGGCVTPFVKPWPGNRHLMDRYRGCSQHAQLRQEAIFSKIKPGDQVVLATTNSYVQGPEAQASYLAAVSALAQKLESRKAGLILFSPFPVFTDRASIKTPLSLCFKEWFRPNWSIPSDCNPAKVDRHKIVEYNSVIKDLQAKLRNQHKNIKVFDPLPILCPPDQGECSTHINGTMMFYDGLHLTGSGGRYLYPAFRSFLSQR